jgi:hypothetical protein
MFAYDVLFDAFNFTLVCLLGFVTINGPELGHGGPSCFVGLSFETSSVLLLYSGFHVGLL